MKKPALFPAVVLVAVFASTFLSAGMVPVSESELNSVTVEPSERHGIDIPDGEEGTFVENYKYEYYDYTSRGLTLGDLQLGLLAVPYNGTWTCKVIDLTNEIHLALDDVFYSSHLAGEQVWYPDTDVINNDPAYVGFEFSDAAYDTIYVNALNFDSPGTEPNGTYVSAYSAEFAATIARAIAIDGDGAMSLLPVMSTATAGIKIGLPTVEAYLPGRTIMDVAVSTASDPIADATPMSFGTMYNDAGGATMSVLRGSLEIAPH